MVWDKLPAKIKILMKQNYQHKVVLRVKIRAYMPCPDLCAHWHCPIDIPHT